MRKISSLCERLGFLVLAGDTDSVFVQIEKSKVKWLKQQINDEVYPLQVGADEEAYHEAILFLGDWEKKAEDADDEEDDGELRDEPEELERRKR